jgi:hypothetical protein
MEMTVKIDIQMKTRRTQTWKKLGNLLSIDSMSFEKRFRIRPIGVDSKNFISHLRIDISKDSCSFLAALIKVQMAEKSAANMNTAKI